MLEHEIIKRKTTVSKVLADTSKMIISFMLIYSAFFAVKNIH